MPCCRSDLLLSCPRGITLYKNTGGARDQHSRAFQTFALATGLEDPFADLMMAWQQKSGAARHGITAVRMNGSPRIIVRGGTFRGAAECRELRPVADPTSLIVSPLRLDKFASARSLLFSAGGSGLAGVVAATAPEASCSGQDYGNNEDSGDDGSNDGSNDDNDDEQGSCKDDKAAVTQGGAFADCAQVKSEGVRADDENASRRKRCAVLTLGSSALDM